MAVRADQRALLMTRASLCSWFRTDCRQCGSNPGSTAAFSRGQNGLRTAVSGKLNLLKKTTFYDLRVSDVYKCPVFGARRTITTLRRLRIEETEAMNCTNRLRRWHEQQPKHLSDIRRVGRGLTGHGVVLFACRVSVGSGEPTWGPGQPFSDLPNGTLLPAKPGQA
jgi:hypothetical protein